MTEGFRSFLRRQCKIWHWKLKFQWVRDTRRWKIYIGNDWIGTFYEDEMNCNLFHESED